MLLLLEVPIPGRRRAVPRLRAAADAWRKPLVLVCIVHRVLLLPMRLRPLHLWVVPEGHSCLLLLGRQVGMRVRWLPLPM